VTASPDDPRVRHEETGRKVTTGPRIRTDFTYSIIETGPSRSGRGAERRGEDRVRSRLREGAVIDRPGRVLAECRIRDLSKRGARLHLEKDVPLPRAFLLTEGGTRRTYRALLAWQVGRDAGVRLIPVD
jgi:hypothetical protein